MDFIVLFALRIRFPGACRRLRDDHIVADNDNYKSGAERKNAAQQSLNSFRHKDESPSKFLVGMRFAHCYKGNTAPEEFVTGLMKVLKGKLKTKKKNMKNKHWFKHTCR
jgi:hypothetical protein